MGRLLGHLENQHPFQQFDRIVIRQNPRLDHRVVLLDGDFAGLGRDCGENRGHDAIISQRRSNSPVAATPVFDELSRVASQLQLLHHVLHRPRWSAAWSCNLWWITLFGVVEFAAGFSICRIDFAPSSDMHKQKRRCERAPRLLLASRESRVRQ